MFWGVMLQRGKACTYMVVVPAAAVRIRFMFSAICSACGGPKADGRAQQAVGSQPVSAYHVSSHLVSIMVYRTTAWRVGRQAVY